MDTSANPQNNGREDAHGTSKRHLLRISILTVCVLASGAGVLHHYTGLQHSLSTESQGDATALRADLINKAAGRTPQYQVFRLKEGIERFFLTDINNPAAGAMAQSQNGPRRMWSNQVSQTHVVSVTNYQTPTVSSAIPDEVAPMGSGRAPFNTEQYDHFSDNPFRRVEDHPVSTFSIDVDTASYANVRRLLRAGVRPPRDAVRIEEFINYFTYDYPVPDQDVPFSVNVETASAPWKPEHRLVRIGLKGYEPPAHERPACNLVFLIDVSGSMSPANKLPLVKRSLQYLVKRLDGRDHVALCVYAGAAGVVLPPTSCGRKGPILAALGRLRAGGSTNGGEGIQLAYDLAREHFTEDAVNRVIIATDGDFNVGTTDRGDLIRFIEDRAREGVFLTTLGFGCGNIKDGRLEQFADKGNGNYGYVDSFEEAKRLLGTKMTGTLVTIAKDVKIQVEFNPAEVSGYRLIGYVNRMLAREDFNDDTKDAGEIGAGHTVTAFYEVVPAGYKVPAGGVDPLRYQTRNKKTSAARSGELLNLKLRYKTPSARRSQPLETPVHDARADFESASPDFRFAAAVAAFGMYLRGAEDEEEIGLDAIYAWADDAMSRHPSPDRREFLELVATAAELPH